MKKNIQNKIIPGILESDLKVIKSHIKEMTPYFVSKKIKRLQFDICDGIFVKSQTFGNNPKEFKNLILLANTLSELYNISTQFDMMVKLKTFTREDKSKNKLDDLLDDIAVLNNAEIIVHYDSINTDEWDYLMETIKDINKINKKTNSNFKGISIMPAFIYKNLQDNNIADIIDFLKKYNFKKIQIMGIKTIGKQGQKLLLDIYNILQVLKNNKDIKKIKIQVDGGCNLQNIDNLVTSGADNVVFGSQIFRGEVKNNIKEIFA
jgi:pentose-5-phosphate-3-epimerase